MNSSNERRPGAETGAARTIAGSEVNPHSTVRTDNYPVTGTFVVDLCELEGALPWPESTPSSIRMALWAIEQIPRGAHVRLRVRNIAFVAEYVAGIQVDHVSIEVESDNPVRLGQWVRGLREAHA